MARKRRRNTGHGSESDDSNKMWQRAADLRTRMQDPESHPGVLRRASASYFGQDMMELDDEDLLDTVGEYDSIADKMPEKNLTKDIVFAYLGYLKKKYGLVRHVRSPNEG